MSNEKKKLLEELCKFQENEPEGLTPCAGPVANWILEFMRRIEELERQVVDLRGGVESNETRLDAVEDAAAGPARLTVQEINYLKQTFES